MEKKQKKLEKNEVKTCENLPPERSSKAPRSGRSLPSKEQALPATSGGHTRLVWQTS